MSERDDRCLLTMGADRLDKGLSHDDLGAFDSAVQTYAQKLSELGYVRFDETAAWADGKRIEADAALRHLSPAT